ncbi:MAG: hypothetical protein AAF721_29445 [Myxococcota bacterium]
MNARTLRILLRSACLSLLVAAGCDGADSLECGEGTVERDGACVVGGTGEDAGDTESGDGDGDGDGDGGGKASGVTFGGEGGDGGDGGDDDGGSGGESEPGECVGEPWGCGQFEGDRACLAQDGCFPVLNCVGTESDCLDFSYGSAECEAAPHCYSDTMQSGGTTLPGCWSYDWACADGDPDLESCEAFGGTCHAANTCEGDPDSCEYVAYDQAGCEAQQGCFWKPA